MTALPAEKSRLTYGDLELDDRQMKVWRAGRLVPLSKFQFDLLKFLMLNPGKVFSRKELLRAVWGDESLGDNTVTTCFARLRRLLVANGEKDVIRCARQCGYSLDHDASDLNRSKVS